MRRRVVALLSVPMVCLSLASCGAGDGPLGSITVSEGGNPTVTVPDALRLTATQTRTLETGKGATVKTGDLVRLNVVVANGTSGKNIDSSFANKSPVYTPVGAGSLMPDFITKALTGKKKGTRLLVAAPSSVWSETMNEQALTGAGITRQDAVVFYVSLDEVVPKGFDIKGRPVTAQSDAPRVTFEAGKPVSIAAEDGTPEEAAKYVLEEGRGKKLAAGGYYAAHYLGQVYPDGEVFDQSWESGTALGGGLGTLIKCWQDLLPGTQEGSRVLLVCPKDVAYGGTESELKDATLMFVIDVVDVA